MILWPAQILESVVCRFPIYIHFAFLIPMKVPIAAKFPLPKVTLISAMENPLTNEELDNLFVSLSHALTVFTTPLFCVQWGW